MSDSEFMRRTAPPANPKALPEESLWTLRKDQRCAEARVRLTPIGLELRFFLYNASEAEHARLVWSRIFRPQDGGTPALHDEALLKRREFEVRGWTLEVNDLPGGFQ
jgi:hypothetical protein